MQERGLRRPPGHRRRLTHRHDPRSEVEQLARTASPVVVAVRACSPAGWVHDRCAEPVVPFQVADTAAVAWRYQHAKRKADRGDALRPAELLAIDRPPSAQLAAGLGRRRRVTHFPDRR